MSKKKNNQKNHNGPIKKNKEGLFNYEVIETYQVGLVLTGPEVKSVKNGQISLKGSYVTVDKKNEAWLVGAYVAPYKPAANVQQKYDSNRRRKLLMHKKEIISLLGKNKQKGLTIIPVSVYTIKGLIKLDIALARGKSQIDKREKIKRREVDRQIRRTLKQ